jgi:hypothetical protein
VPWRKGAIGVFWLEDFDNQASKPKNISLCVHECVTQNKEPEAGRMKPAGETGTSPQVNQHSVGIVNKAKED